MNAITHFRVSKLHGCRTVDLRIDDNTLILVGENGAGKTTVLNLLYYLLSGQWRSLARYQFEQLSITIGDAPFTLAYADIETSLERIDRGAFRHLPPSLRQRLLRLLENTRGRITPELQRLCNEYGVPIHLVIEELEEFGGPSGKKADKLRDTLEAIRDEMQAQVLYLPTYRRIEQELNLIFKGLDEREVRSRREVLASRRGNDTFVELIEFGMSDVETAIRATLTSLNTFARESLNNLTFSYLGDIVNRQYAAVDLNRIREVDEETINKVLERIQEHILSMENRQTLHGIIERAKRDVELEEHQRVICHYFLKLMSFQKDLEDREDRITSFCRVCNEYMADKMFAYDTSRFACDIQLAGGAGGSQTVELSQLSSGEKQIVSLFSHLYLSGGTDYYVLIDEPELSLSVPWQRRFLVDIRTSAFCRGLVAVTHSPFIYDNSLARYAHGLGEFFA